MFVLVASIVVWLGVPAVPTSAAPPPAYRPPVDRPVEQGFDMSRGRYGAGNRGLDFAVRPGDDVAAIGPGVVEFAGSVAGRTWVTVRHPDGLRSSSGPLATVLVTVGEQVVAGQALGATGSTFHLGVRRGSTYIDPATLFRVRRRHARLVPISGTHRLRGYTVRSRDQIGAPVERPPWPTTSDSSPRARPRSLLPKRGAMGNQPKGSPFSWPQSSP